MKDDLETIASTRDKLKEQALAAIPAGITGYDAAKHVATFFEGYATYSHHQLTFDKETLTAALMRDGTLELATELADHLAHLVAVRTPHRYKLI